jgi:hypothetical protein
MDDEDYRALIELVAFELRRSGAPDIANERHYVAVDDEDGQPRLHEPQKRLILMLEAFERHVAVQDRAVVEKSLDTIGRTLQRNARAARAAVPERVVVELASDGYPREIDLADAPDMEVVREDLYRLIARLRDIGLLER